MSPHVGYSPYLEHICVNRIDELSKTHVTMFLVNEISVLMSLPSLRVGGLL